MATNVVLYRLAEGKRHPLGSFDPKDGMLSMKINAKASQEYRDCDARGNAHSEMKIVRETRIADGDGRLTKEEFVLLDAITLEPKGKSTSDLNSLFEEKK